jgi:type IV fimbrial biogenesis protein FimT
MIELLVVMSIAAILLSIAVPSMTAMMATQRSKSLGNAFLTSLNLARNEAIKRNGRVVLCKSADGLSCLSSGGWEQGWAVFHDGNNNAAIDTDIGEKAIQLQGAAPQGLHLTGNTNVANYVSFSASGVAKLISGAFQSGTLTLCLDPVSSADVQQIILSATGRARLQKGGASSCG